MLMLKYKTGDRYRVSRLREPDRSREAANVESPRLRASSGGLESSKGGGSVHRRWGALLLLFVLMAANRMVWNASSPWDGISRGSDGVVSLRAGWLDDIVDSLNDNIEELDDQGDDPGSEPAPTEEQVATVRAELEQDVDALQAENIYTEEHPDISIAEVDELLTFMRDLVDFLDAYQGDTATSDSTTVN